MISIGHLKNHSRTIWNRPILKLGLQNLGWAFYKIITFAEKRRITETAVLSAYSGWRWLFIFLFFIIKIRPRYLLIL